VNANAGLALDANAKAQPKAEGRGEKNRRRFQISDLRSQIESREPHINLKSEI